MKDHEKFKDLAEKRVNRTIKDIRLVGNLSNRNNYDFTDDDAQKIISALEKEIKELKARFFSTDSKGTRSFSL